MLRYLLKAMRPKQWAKQIFVPAALVADGKLFDPYYVGRTAAAIIIFCLISSAVYLMNDLVDIEKDRAHPVKRNRPLPSGKLPPRVAVLAAIVLAVVGLGASGFLGLGFLLVALTYVVINAAYTFVFKEVLILDLLSIAAFYVLRVVAGVVVVDVARFSPWLYVCTTFLALFIAIGKRRQEQVLLAGNAANHRTTLASYTVALLDQFTMVVVSATLMAYSLYTFSAPNLPPNHAMMLTIPFVIYGLFRYMYLVEIKGLGGAPEEVVLHDRPLLLDGALYLASVVTVLYLLPGGA